MKLPRPSRRPAGILLIECMVYLAVFGILLGGGTTVFYFCWDHTRAIITTSHEVQDALLAGERWRADVRAATGKISVTPTATGETMTIPTGRKTVIYQRTGSELRREISGQNAPAIVPFKIAASEMEPAARNGATAWRWELQIAPRFKAARLPLRFTFAAAQSTP